MLHNEPTTDRKGAVVEYGVSVRILVAWNCWPSSGG